MSAVRDADLIIAVSGVTLSLISLIRLFSLAYLERNVRGSFLCSLASSTYIVFVF